MTEKYIPEWARVIFDLVLEEATYTNGTSLPYQAPWAFKIVPHDEKRIAVHVGAVRFSQEFLRQVGEVADTYGLEFVVELGNVAWKDEKLMKLRIWEVKA